jgi:hypothetical protein
MSIGLSDTSALSTEAPILVSVKRACELLDIGNSKIWELIRKNELEIVSLGEGGKKHVVFASITDLVARRRAA